jgi:predicted ATPase
MRSLEDVELELSSPSARAQGDEGGGELGLTVLIGPNGAGKSTIVEACELVRKIGVERPFIGKLYDTHGGPPVLVRRGAKRFGFGVELRSADGTEFFYVLLLRVGGTSVTVEYEEAAMRDPDDRMCSLFTRTGNHSSDGAGAAPFSPGEPSLRSLVERARRHFEHPSATGGRLVAEDDLALAVAPHNRSELDEIQAALASIEVHSAIDSRPAWMMGSSEPGSRTGNVIRPATRVEPGGRNLANVYHALRNQRDWPQTLARVRLALGDQIEDVLTPADPSGGRIGLAIRVAGVGEVPAFSMSDGQLAYLALLGVLRLQRPTPPALVVFDEPDLHLHPSLARRVMADLETFARSTPVLAATQSDAMLDALTDPASASILCELDERHATQLVRPDREGLARWLEDYRGLGELRAAGYEGVVFPTLQTP